MAQLLSNLPIGSKVKFGKHSINGENAQSITWLVVAKNHNGYPSNSVTLLTEKIIDLRAIDGREKNVPGALNDSLVGNNDYGLSNMDSWLNSSLTEWYNARHPNDQPPSQSSDPGVGFVSNSTQYYARPGFLSNFTEEERNAILESTIPVTKYLSEVENLTQRRVFLPSLAELGVSVSDEKIDGFLWEYFSTSPRETVLTSQCYEHTLSPNKPTDLTQKWHYWVRSARSSLAIETYFITYMGSFTRSSPDSGQYGVRPALNLSANTTVSATIDSDGCYSVVWNSPPHIPTISVPFTIYGGKVNPISWSEVIDPDGDVVKYRLECSMDGGDYTEIYNGSAIVYAHMVPFGVSTVSYRVKATDIAGESSAYMTSATINVVNNNAPVISGSDINLGVKTDDFTGTYTITDANSDIVTVTEAIDGIQIRALVANLGEEITYGVTGNTWLALANGSHTLTISATDGIDTTVRTIVFTKLADKFSIRNSTPWASSTMPSRIMVVVTRNVPSTSKFKVEVCNNGYDASPTWEDATDAVVSGLVHVFSNTKKTASNWGVVVKVSVERNGATGACYVSAIGGNFE